MSIPQDEFLRQWREALRRQRLNNAKLARFAGVARPYLYELLAGQQSGCRCWPKIWKLLGENCRQLLREQGLYCPERTMEESQ